MKVKNLNALRKQTVALLEAERCNFIKALESNPAKFLENYGKVKGELGKLKPELNSEELLKETQRLVGMYIISAPTITAILGDYRPLNLPLIRELEGFNNQYQHLYSREDYDRLIISYIDEQQLNLDEQLQQELLCELLNPVVKIADPKEYKRFGAVYTPPVIVDFIYNSITYLLNKEFQAGEDAMLLLEPFNGFGIFIVRAIQLSKLNNEILGELIKKGYFQAHEISPFPYTVSLINIAIAIKNKTGESPESLMQYIQLKDTFAQ